MQANVIFDTGSDWLLIEGRDCINCKNNNYDPNTSSLFAEVNMKTGILSMENLKGSEQTVVPNFVLNFHNGVRTTVSSMNSRVLNITKATVMLKMLSNK